MSGHSKWSTIKRQKGLTDAKRGQVFTKLSKEIAIAVREGGSSPDANARLRLAVQKAKDQNMPLDNIDRAIKKASGEGEGSSLSEVTFEGYGPGGVALLVQAVTDNRNRTLQEVRSTLTRGGGSMGEAGSVAWLFEAKGVITIEASETDSEDTALWAIDAGAQDVKMEGTYLEIYTEPVGLAEVRTCLEDKGANIASAELSMVPKSTLELEESVQLQAMKLIDRLEALDDVQRVFSNIDLSDAALEKYQSSMGTE